jgi:methylation protein EvaC
MRYVLQAGGKVQSSVAGLQVLERAHFEDGLAPYQAFAQQARERIEKFGATLRLQTVARKRIWGYGANAKGAVLLQATGLTAATMERVVDDTEAKQGLLMPGTDIPITDAHDLSEPDILVLLSWNNAEELKAKAKARGFRGRFLLPHD